MPENEVISEISAPERKLELPPPDTVETALADCDDQSAEAAAAPVTDAAPKGSQVETLEHQSGTDIELDTANSLPSTPIERDMHVLFTIVAAYLLFHDQEETAYARYPVTVGGQVVQQVAMVRSKAFRQCVEPRMAAASDVARAGPSAPGPVSGVGAARRTWQQQEHHVPVPTGARRPQRRPLAS